MLQMLQAAPVAGAIFLITIATSAMDFLNNLQYRPRFILNPYQIVHRGEWYRVLTSGLIHGDWTHLIVNMLTFYFFAFKLEMLLGHWQFLVLYVTSMAIADLTSVARNKDNPHYNSLGASGAISGVLFSFILFKPFVTLLIFFVIPMPAFLFAVLFVLYSAYAGRFLPGNINHDAHLWGAIGGLVLTPLLKPEVLLLLEQHWRQLQQFLG